MDGPLIAMSTGKSKVVFAGTLYKITGIEELSATLKSIDIILHGWVGGIEKFAHVVVIFSNHECGNIFNTHHKRRSHA